MTRIKQNISLSRMVEDFTSELADYARWPDVPTRQLAIDQDVKILADALHGFDPVIPNALYLLIIANLIDLINLREIPRRGLRAALLKLADVIDPPKLEEQEKKAG